MELGISTACYYPTYLEEAVEQLGANGVQTIEIFANTYSELEGAGLRRLQERLRFYDTRVVSLHPFTSGFEPFLLFTPYERRFQDGMEQYRCFFHAAATLGASFLVFHGNHKQSPFPDEQYYERFALLRQLGKRAGVRLAQENVAPFKSYSPTFIQAMRQYLHDEVDFVLDIKQVIRSGLCVEEMLEAMGTRICHLHLSDHMGASDCLPIGAGNFDFGWLFKRLLQQGYEGAAVLELYRNNYGHYSELYGSLTKLKQLLGKARNLV